MKYIGIVGTRRRDTTEDFEEVREAFFSLYQPGDIIVSGGCPKGGDRFAEMLAGEIGRNPEIFYPDKGALDPLLLKKNPRAAYAQINYARNTRIALRSEHLIACVAPDRKGGTEDTIKKFQRKCKARGWNAEERLHLV